MTTSPSTMARVLRLIKKVAPNIRELADVLERAQIMAQDHLVTLDEVPDAVVEAGPTNDCSGTEACCLREVERRHVLQTLQREKGNKLHAARALGVSRRALYRLIEKHRLHDYGCDQETIPE